MYTTHLCSLLLFCCVGEARALHAKNGMQMGWLQNGSSRKKKRKEDGKRTGIEYYYNMKQRKSMKMDKKLSNKLCTQNYYHHHHHQKKKKKGIHDNNNNSSSSQSSLCLFLFWVCVQVLVLVLRSWQKNWRRDERSKKATREL
jgi:hypothetical protein